MSLERHPRLLIVALGLLFIAAGLGLRDPWPSDEPRFALVAKEMVESGQWFFPTRGGELYPDKPPLFMWAQAVVYRITGSIRLASGLPSLLAGLAVLLLVHDLGRRLWDPRTGLVAALFLLLTPQFVLEARAGQIDALVTAWIALGLYGFLRHLLLGPDRLWLWTGFAACGFGVITKGVGFLPLLVFLPWLMARRHLARPRDGTALRDGLLGVGCLLGAIALWLLPMVLLVAQSGDPDFVAYRDNILFKQTGERYVAPSHHFQPWWYFLGEVIPSLWLPLFLLLPWLLPAWWRGWRAGDARLILLLGWVVLVITFFSLSPGKRGVYILPALPWACLAAAPFLPRLLQRAGVRRLTLAVGLLFSAASFAGALYLLFGAPERLAELVARYRFDPLPALWLAGAGTLLATLLGGFRARRPALAWGGVMLSLWLVYGLYVYPRLDATKSGRALMERVERELADDQPLALVDWKEQLILQARRPVDNFGFLVPLPEQVEAARRWLAAHPRGMLLVQGRSMAPCFDPERSIALGEAHRRQWFLAGPAALLDDCDPAATGRTD